MANISCNIAELHALLSRTPASHNIMLCAGHGVGKSEVLTDFFTRQDIKVVSLFLAQMEVGDLIGLPNKNQETGKTEFMPPYWFPTDGKPICLFLDEVNRASNEVLNAIFDLCLNRKLAGRSLPEGSRVIAAINDDQSLYTVNSLDPALVSRWNIVNFKPTVEEWLLWAKKQDLDNRVISFIEENKIHLDKLPEDKEGQDHGLDRHPDRRSWVRVSDVIKGRDLDDMDNKLISSIVGPKAAALFVHHASTHKTLSGKDILNSFPKHLKTLQEYDLHILSTINEGIFRTLAVEKVSDRNVRTYAKNVDDYFAWLSKNKREAAAHFTSLYTSDMYSTAIGFLAKQAPMLTLKLVEYVKTIR